MAELEIKKFQSRFTNENVEAVRFTGKQDQLLDILDWVINNDGRAQGNVRQDPGLDLLVHEHGIGLITVKPGEFIVKTESGFEVCPVLQFSQVYKKVSPVIKVIRKPLVFESMQFTGGIENENEIEEWLKASSHKGTFRHAIPGTTITYYRIELADGMGSTDVPLNHWIVQVGSEIQLFSNEEYIDQFQEVK